MMEILAVRMEKCHQLLCNLVVMLKPTRRERRRQSIAHRIWGEKVWLDCDCLSDETSQGR